MDDQYEQGRFGPPPVVGWSVTAQRGSAGPWSLAVSSRREGQRFERTLTIEDASLHDLIEAVMTEVYRLG